MTEPLRPPADVTPSPIETEQVPISLPTPACIGKPATDTEPASTPHGITISTWPKENQQ